MRRIPLLAALIILLLAVVPIASFAAPVDRDQRIDVPASAFTARESGEWQTPWTDAPKPFDELIYSWGLSLPDGQGVRFQLQVRFADGTESDWLYAGYWGEVGDLIEDRKIPTFEGGKLDYDQLLIDKPASAFRYRAVSAGAVPLSVLPSLRVVTTDNRIAATSPSAPTLVIPRVMDLPLRLQRSSTGEKMPDRCQSAAVATAMEFYGKSLKFEDIVALTNDPEYDLAGIWPRTLGAATQQGFTAYIDRFRDWDAVVRALNEKKVILCSIRMNVKGDYIDPPYRSIGGHIVALAGMSPDGEIVYIVDSALSEENEGYLVPWYRTDFEKVWLSTKGGVGMVVVPPAGAEIRYAEKLPKLMPRRKVYREARTLLRNNTELARKQAPSLLAGIESLSPAERKKAEEKHKAAIEDADDAERLANELTEILLEGWKQPITQ
jgi:hypothetical protein